MGTENQTTIDSDMPIRVKGYHYAVYRNQRKTSTNRAPLALVT